jgi:hypothetical protein
LNKRYRIQDTGYRIQDTGYKILDAAYMMWGKFYGDGDIALTALGRALDVGCLVRLDMQLRCNILTGVSLHSAAL